MKTNISALFKCSHCELNFLSKEGMVKHYTRVHERKGSMKTRFKCDLCNADFDSKQDFKKHKLPKKVKCDGCDKKGVTFIAENKCEFSKHLTFYNFHKKDDAKSRSLMKCIKCKLEFKNTQLLKLHQVHSAKLVCKKPSCGKVFYGSCKLEKHTKFDVHVQGSNKHMEKNRSKSIVKPAVIDLNTVDNEKHQIPSHRQERRQEPKHQQPFQILEEPNKKDKINPTKHAVVKEKISEPKVISKENSEKKQKPLIKPALIDLNSANFKNDSTDKNRFQLESKVQSTKSENDFTNSIKRRSSIETKTVQPTESKISKEKKILDVPCLEKTLASINIHFFYPTFTEQELIEQEIIENFSSESFWPSQSVDDDLNTQQHQSENNTSFDLRIQESEVKQREFEGISILGL